MVDKNDNSITKMKTVYAVGCGCYSDYHIRCIFSTRELAEKYVEIINSKAEYSMDKCEVEAYVLDEPQEEWVTTMVRMKKNGDVASTWESFYSGKGFACYDVDNNLVYGVATENKIKAIKVTNEIRTILLAHGVFGDMAKTSDYLSSQSTNTEDTEK